MILSTFVIPIDAIRINRKILCSRAALRMLMTCKLFYMSLHLIIDDASIQMKCNSSALALSHQ